MQKTAFLPAGALAKAGCSRNVPDVLSMGVFTDQLLKRSPRSFRFLTKTLFVMRLTIFFLVLGLFNARAEGFSQTVTFSGKDISIARIFHVIESQTDYKVFANKKLLKEAMPVSFSVQNMPLENFLHVIFKDQPIGYEIENKTIFIRRKTEAPANYNLTVEPPAPVVTIPVAEISGTVLSADGTPLEGATVMVKGTKTLVLTDASGRFSIQADPGQTLVITYIGYKEAEEPVRGRTTIEVRLEKAVDEIEQVVVTALGISKKAKALSYNVQEIKSAEVNRVVDANFVNSLNGKIAGATINSSSAGTGTSSRIVLRGTKSLMYNNNALYVIDGIPVQNEIRGQAEDIFSGAGQTGDFGANINPDDIESISVLSGPSAAALYGSAAANGVIMITTKKGQRGKLNVSLSNSTMASNPLILPEFQNTYGPSDIGSYYSWGEKLATPSTYDPADFFQTGVNSTTSLTVSTGSEKSQTYLSLGNVKAKGIVPNNDYDRINFTARNSSELLNGKMTLDIGFMGSLVKEQNMISQGQYFNPLVAVYLFPPGDDFNKVRPFERHNSSRNLMTQSWLYGDNGLLMQNPYWVTQRDLFQNRKERYMANMSLKYNLASWINLQGRVKMDKNNEKAEKKFAASTNTLFASENGYYALNTFDTRQLYADVLANINKELGNDFDLTANAGASIEDIVANQYMYGGKLLGVANLYTYQNINRLTSEMSQTGFHRQKQSLFATAQVGYKDMLYLDVTARNDWASTLAGPAANPSFFYSSAGISAVLSDLLDIKSSTLSYLKLRTSYSEVGNEPGTFLTIPTYPFAGTYPRTQTGMPNPYLNPERTKSLEIGLNAALFSGALRIDATVYQSRTYDQFFNPTLSSTSGFLDVFVNGGRVDNKGIEASARYTGKFGELGWTSYANFSLNRNKVKRLLRDWVNPVTGQIVNQDDIDQSGTGSYKMTLTEGGSMGDIYVNTLRVDEHGAIYVDPSSQTVAGDPNTFVYAGNSNPKYNLGWGNTLTWKGLSLNFLFTARVGGIVVSNTQAILDAFGVSKASADARDAGGALVNGRPIPAKEYYQIVGSGASGGFASMYCYGATNVRLGELSLGYDLPVKRWTSVIKSATVSLIGRNLFFLYNEAPFDPELTANTQTYFQGIDYFMMPSLRSMGVSVKLNF